MYKRQVHFYITIIAILLCLAIAVAYLPVVLKPRYFWSIALAGILSLVSAVAPLGMAFLQGTPLEGSLRWALSVMTPGSSGETIEEAPDDNSTDQTGELVENTENEVSSDEIPSYGEDSSEIQPSEDTSALTKIKTFLTDKGKAILFSMKSVCGNIKTKFLRFNETIILSLIHI